MDSLRGDGSASAALPVHARFTDTTPRTAPNLLLPTTPEDAPHLDLAPPLFRKARSRTLSNPGDGSGLGTGDAYLVAVDALTGEPVGDFGAGGRIDLMAGIPRAKRSPPPLNYSVTSPPVVVGDVVVVGSVVSDQPSFKEQPPGHVRGYDAGTGELLWTFHTIPLPGEFGHDTWEDGSWRYTGNTNVWSPMTADPELGYVYLPVGTPTMDFYGVHRPGDNLFANSLVALDARTGERVWHFQLVHHDLWDYDPPAAPNLVDITVGGRSVRAVAQVTKHAYVFVFDRVTGEPVWPVEERPAPASDVPGERSSPTQPHPTRGRHRSTARASRPTT